MKTQTYIYLSAHFLPSVKNIFKLFIILIACLSLVSCIFSANTAPTVDRSKFSRVQIKTHRVKSGETLFAIAWRYGVDYKELARINGIGNNFLIYANQTLKLPAGARTSSAYIASTKTPARSKSLVKPKVRSSKKTRPKKNVSRKASRSTSSSTQKVSRSEKKSSSSKSVATSKLSNTKISWRWPAKGVVITNFSSKEGSNKGIDIRGKKGDSVEAAASGKVVYAGSGLRGYGNLVIVKHNETYLSAYAHNDRIRVKEGQMVKAGQHIADIGSSGSRTDGIVKLHFEIRRDGKPINPLRLLPKRKG